MSMDWTNAADVVQAIYWTVLFIVFCIGYGHGNRMV